MYHILEIYNGLCGTTLAANNVGVVNTTLTHAWGDTGSYCSSKCSSCSIPLHLCCLATTAEVQVYLLHIYRSIIKNKRVD